MIILFSRKSCKSRQLNTSDGIQVFLHEYHCMNKYRMLISDDILKSNVSLSAAFMWSVYVLEAKHEDADKGL